MILPITFDLLVNIYLDTDNPYIAAATYKGFYIPDGELISGEKNAIIPPQALADYNAFIVSVEDLCIDYYGLELTYLNFSEDNSNYYNFIAKDAYGNPILKFRLRLRVSTHPAHRTKLQQQHKKEEEQSTELHRFTRGKKLTPYTIDYVLNKENTEIKSYEDAFIQLDQRIQRAIEVMTR